jgi:catechol 2,3-dioxygenase-like lactoylglutathione lyase family enzyme
MLFVTDLMKSVTWYRDLLGLTYLREFENADTVTGCSLADPEAGYLLSFRLRSATAGQPDARGEHPLIFGVHDVETLDRVYAHAEALGYRPTRGAHTDAQWVEVIDPDGMSTRGRMTLVAVGELLRDADGGLAIRRGGGAVRVAAPVGQPPAVGGDRQRVRGLARKPRRRRRRRGGEIDADSPVVEQLECLVQPGEVILAFAGFELGPGEDPDRDEVDLRPSHELDVFAPNFGRPLLRVIVPAVREASFPQPMFHAGARLRARQR